MRSTFFLVYTVYICVYFCITIDTIYMKFILNLCYSVLTIHLHIIHFIFTYTYKCTNTILKISHQKWKFNQIFGKSADILQRKSTH